ncbi:MAG: FAD-dependent oxidoreductase, partial [Pseudomonadota bacterium]
MKRLQVDVAIIGAGTAGLAAHRAATRAGASVVMIEGGPYGTTCARVGCMPSKLLIAAAEAAHQITIAPGFGVHIDGEVRIDGCKVMARVKRERDRFVGFVLRDVERIPEAERLRGHARFKDDHTLIVDEHTRVSAKAIVIATGSHATYPAAFKKLGDRLIINDDIFEWTDLPKSVAVMGPGVIGLEIG